MKESANLKVASIFARADHGAIYRLLVKLVDGLLIRHSQYGPWEISHQVYIKTASINCTLGITTL